MFRPPRPSDLPDQDLVNLGWVAFGLWTGNAHADASLDIRESQHWPQDDPPLKDFVYRLLGLETPFSTAVEARQALLKLRPPTTVNDARSQREKASVRRKSWRVWLLSLLALPLVGGLIWLLLPRTARSDAETMSFKRLLPSFSDVNGIQPGQYPYTGQALGTWSTVLDKKPVSDQNIRALLTQPRTDIAALFGYRPYAPQRSPLKEVLAANSKANFAVISLSTQLPEGIIRETVACDGLLVYIPAYKSQNLPSTLGGRISFTQLRQIFTGQITNWQQLDSSLPNLPIKPYRPLEPEALQLFQEKILDNDPTLTAKFNKIKQRSTFNTLRSIAAGEQQSRQVEAGTISFGLLAQIWDQCKVYPLAVADRSDPVQPLLKETTAGTRQPITPSDNLCLEKKPLPNISAFHTASYPLSAPLVVAYPRDNNLPGHSSGPTFAKFLKTQDGQYLLQQAGLVPLQTPPRDYTPSSFIQR